MEIDSHVLLMAVAEWLKTLTPEVSQVFVSPTTQQKMLPAWTIIVENAGMKQGIGGVGTMTYVLRMILEDNRHKENMFQKYQAVADKVLTSSIIPLPNGQSVWASNMAWSVKHEYLEMSINVKMRVRQIAPQQELHGVSVDVGLKE